MRGHYGIIAEESIRDRNLEVSDGVAVCRPREIQRLVFISHAGEDTWVAKRIALQIGSLGVATFLDESDVRVGEDFEQRILPALNRADELLVYLTPWALKRQYVWMEIGAAWARGIPIVCVLHGITPGELQGSDVPVVLKRRNLIKINEIDRYIQELAERGGLLETNLPGRRKDDS